MFIVFAVAISWLKVCLIPLFRLLVVRWIQTLGDANALVSFVQEHGDVPEWESKSTALHVAAGSGCLKDNGIHNSGLHLAVPRLIEMGKVDKSIMHPIRQT